MARYGSKEGCDLRYGSERELPMELQVLAEIDDCNVLKRREKYTNSQQDEDRLRRERKHGSERSRRGGQDMATTRPRMIPGVHAVIVLPIGRLILDQGDLKAELAHRGERAGERRCGCD